MRVFSTFSGISAASVAWKPMGFQFVGFCEPEPFPCSVLNARCGATAPKYLPDDEPDTVGKNGGVGRGKVRRGKKWYRAAYRHITGGTVPNFGDVSKITDADLEALGSVDVLEGGSPCFVAGTLILTDRGMKPIENVNPGDMVLTHKGRYMPVVRVGGRRNAPITVLRGQGHWGIRTTEEHPFYSIKRTANGFTAPEWIPAKDMKGRHWASPSAFPSIPVPDIETVGLEKVGSAVNADLMWLAGAYLGDGWTRFQGNSGCVILGVNDRKAELIIERLDRIGLKYTRTEQRTTSRLAIHGRAIARWMKDNFGSGSGGKRIPSWSLGMDLPRREALFDGYVAMDGNVSPEGVVRVNSVCKELSVGFRLLCLSLGRSCGIQYVKTPDTTVIEGRTVNQRDYHSVRSSTSNRTSVEIDGIRYGCVRAVSDGGTDDVYNLEVDYDNSYVADGIVVHNCQAFSVAGLRHGLSDARGNLTLEFVRLALRMRRLNGLRYVIWENVPGVLNHGDNPFGCLLSGLVGEGSPLVAPGGKWTNAGHVAGPEGAAAWRVLDAQGWGVPQRRRRVFLVCRLGDGPVDPGTVLFVREGLCRSAEAGGGSGEAAAGGAGAGAAGDAVAYGIRADATREGIAKTPSADAEGRIRLRNPGLGISTDVAPTIDASAVHAVAAPAYGFDPYNNAMSEGLSPTLGVNCGMSTGRNLAVQPAYALCDDYTPKAAEDTAYTLLSGSPTGGGHKQCVAHPVAFMAGQGAKAGSVAASEDVSPTLRAGDSGTNRTPSVAQAVTNYGSVAGCLTARHDSSPGATGGMNVVAHPAVVGTLPAGGAAVRYIVRRLLPVECERLQGFPDGWTDVSHRGKPAADGPRYKALGNSMAVPCMAFVGRGLMQEHTKETSRG